MLSIYYWVRYWRTYVWGTSFKVYTDHSPLRGIKTKKDVSRKLTRMILNLQEYDFLLYYTPGKQNVVADALSRNPIAGFNDQCNVVMDDQQVFSGLFPVDGEIGISPMELLCAGLSTDPVDNREERRRTTESLRQKELQMAREYLNKVENMNDPYNLPFLELAKLQAQDETLEPCIRKAVDNHESTTWLLKDECLLHIRKHRRSKKKDIQLVLPKCLREGVMKAHHDELLGGHCGYHKTLNKVNKWYWWPKMKEDIKEWVNTCPVCQTHSRNFGPKVGKLAPVTAQHPFHILGMDILTSLPVTARGNRSIILFTDYYTKWVEAYAMPNEEAITVATRFIKGVLCRHGAPVITISDRGTQFTSDVYKEVSEMLGIKMRMTTTYNPMADGQAEKAIGTLTNTLSKLVGSNPNDWDLMIPYALWAYRTAKHATTKESPYFLIYGREPVDPADVKIKHWIDSHSKIENYTREVAQRLLEAKQRVDEEVAKIKKKQKIKFDKNRIDNPFKVNDLVWWKVDSKTVEENRKLKAKFTGPYKVTQIIKQDGHDLNVEITNLNNLNDKHVVSIRKLKSAKLRPEMIGDLPLEIQEVIPLEKPKIEASNSRNLELEPPIEKSKEVKNPKGRNVYTQAQRAGKTKKKVDTRDEYEVEGIMDERINPNTKELEYKIKWVGYRRATWEPLSNLENAQEFVNEWKMKKKFEKGAK